MFDPDLLEKDINNIFSNNITPDRLERLGTGIISNGQMYDSESINPKHKMLGEYEKPSLIHNNISKNVYAESLQEYTIIIDSADRDIEKYLNNQSIDYVKIMPTYETPPLPEGPEVRSGAP